MILTQTVLGLVVAGTVLAAWSIPLVASTMACHRTSGRSYGLARKKRFLRNNLEAWTFFNAAG